MLSEDSRSKLDGIIQQMTANNENESDIQFVVNDFKSKYDAPASAPVAPAVPSVASSPSFMGGVGDALSKRAANIGDVWAKPTNDPRQEPSVMSAFTRSPNVALQTMGQVAGGVNDVIGEGLKAGYRNLVPEGAQQAISGFGNDLLKSGPGQSAVSLMQAIQEKYGKAKQAFPEGMRNVEAVTNIAGAVPMGWAGKEGAGIIKGAVTPVINLSNVEQAIDKAIVNGIQKGIKPTVVGKSDAGLVRSYYDKAKTAVREIVDSSPVPLSQSQNVLEDFSQAVMTTKKKIHAQYSQMAADAGAEGAMVDLRPVISDMVAMGTNPNTIRANKNIVDILASKVKEWEALPTMVNPVEAEDLISRLNQEAKQFWKDPTANTVAATVERIAQQTRKQTFDAIEDYKGPGYAELRKRYGAQLALEKEVADRATVAGRRSPYGFFDLANIPAAAEFVGALSSGNALGVAKAGAMLTAKSFMQSRNDPSNIIRKMFKDVETLNAIKARYTTP